jgi:hypothetical protein
MQDFVAMPKIARLSRNCVITEKIDGTNASILVTRLAHPAGAGEFTFENGGICVYDEPNNEWYELMAGSRTRWIFPEKGKDNYGFAQWAYDHAQELVTGLGEGHHFGEWWGSGIQRGYGLKEKRFSLFNVARWGDGGKGTRPSCCHVVPVIWDGPFTEITNNHPWGFALERLRQEGSFAAPGFMNPEGIVIWHEAARVLFKKTLEKDDEWKGKDVRVKQGRT